MIQSLKKKFVLLAMVSLCLLLAVIVSGMNMINFHAIVHEADDTLALLSENRGSFPNFYRGSMPPGMSPEAPYETRFFSVLLREDGSVAEVLTTRIAAVDRESALDYAARAQNEGHSRGFIDNFRYVSHEEECGTRFTFLDCGRKLHAFKIFLRGSVIMSLAGLVVVFCVMMFSAERMIRPVSESYEKQKRFITDAGHEIKTPLTIISANVDLLEMDIGENECLSDIQQQARCLTALTNDLVYLARMEEARDAVELVELPVSDIVQESVAAFKAVAQGQDKELMLDIEPMLSIKGDHKALQQLISILMDNALKYSPAGEDIRVSFHRQGKSLKLSVKNKCLSEVTPENLKHLFERFYRTDSSRNSSTGGHGIGLSVASAIAAAHGGRIQAQSPDGTELEIIVSFPV